MRLFIAIELHHAWRAALSRLVSTAARPRDAIRWVRPDALHLTLWFLGEVSEDRLPAVRAVMTAACARVAPFELRMGSLGCFPSRGRPRVLWVGADDAASGCRNWIEAAHPELTALGFTADERPFQPHITLARVDDAEAGEALQSLTRRLQVPAVAPMSVDAVTLFSSRLTTHGPHYEALQHVPLAFSGGETAAPDREA